MRRYRDLSIYKIVSRLRATHGSIYLCQLYRSANLFDSLLEENLPVFGIRYTAASTREQQVITFARITPRRIYCLSLRKKIKLDKIHVICEPKRRRLGKERKSPSSRIYDRRRKLLFCRAASRDMSLWYHPRNWYLFKGKLRELRICLDNREEESRNVRGREHVY